MKNITEETMQKLFREEPARYSLCSETDDELKLMPSFGNKKVRTSIFGEENAAVDSYGFGYACHKGKKPECPNQDSWFMLQIEGVFSIYAVFDGHGLCGHYVSNFVKDNLPKLLLRDNRLRNAELCADCLRDAFLDMQMLIAAATALAPSGVEPLSASLSGTTATVAVHDRRERKVTIAHVGDSGAALGTIDKSDKEQAMNASPLTEDHKPTVPEEKTRIEKAGGTVVFDGYANHRVFVKGTTCPGLNMSRCLGDLLGHDKAGVSAMPDVSERWLKPSDKLLLLCSDGIWEFMEPQEVVDFVWKFGPERATEAAEALAQEAWNRWIENEGGMTVDDITCLIVFLQTVDRI